MGTAVLGGGGLITVSGDGGVVCIFYCGRGVDKGWVSERVSAGVCVRVGLRCDGGGTSQLRGGVCLFRQAAVKGGNVTAAVYKVGGGRAVIGWWQLIVMTFSFDQEVHAA